MTTATAARQRKPRPKPARSVRVVLAPTALMAGVVQITVGSVTVDYFVEGVRADFGAGFRLSKILGGDVYHVNLDGPRSSCTCKGATLGKSGRCKHIDGLQALCDRKRI